jgi:RNA polymerase sigma-70 factor (ECF subfamily)
MQTGDRRGGGGILSFEELYRRYYDRVVRYVIYRGFPTDEARDLAQDIFFRVFQHMETYRGESQWNFIEITARHYLANVFRAKHAQKRYAVTSSLHELERDVRDNALPADAAMEIRETAAKRQREFQNAIAQLGPGSREAFLLRLKGGRYKDIAELLGISLDAVRARIHEARVRLKAQLGQDPPGNDDHDRE